MRGVQALAILACTILAACSPVPMRVGASLTPTKLAGPFVGSPAWITPDELVISQAAGLVDHASLVRGSLLSGTLVPLSVPVPSDCTAIDAILPTLWKGRIVLDRHCYGVITEPSSQYNEILSLAPDGTGLRVEARMDWGPSSYAQLSTGPWLRAYGPDVCGWIEPVPGSGSLPSWWPSCDRRPLAGSVAAAPDGLIAFAASGDGRNRSGFSRLDASFGLYLADPGGQVKRIASGLVNPSNLRLDPNGTNLVVLATIDGHVGAWRFDRVGRRELLWDGQADGVAWSPDGRRIAVTVRTSPGGAGASPQATVYLIDVP